MYSIFSHHDDTIRNVIEKFEQYPAVRGLLLGGSIAHGFATASSDVDILIIVDQDEYHQRKAENTLLYYNRELSTYPDGYVDGKYITEDYLRLVAQKGNEPTRYAFSGASCLISHSPELATLVSQAARFPAEAADANFHRFCAQLIAWQWFYSEGRRHDNEHLMHTAISNFTLYACRIVLNRNNMLYPYLKWMLQETGRAPCKPETIITDLLSLAKSRSVTRRQKLMETISQQLQKQYAFDPAKTDWPRFFMEDVETVWMQHESFISDI